MENTKCGGVRVGVGVKLRMRQRDRETDRQLHAQMAKQTEKAET